MLKQSVHIRTTGERARIANQIQGFRIPDRLEAGEKKSFITPTLDQNCLQYFHCFEQAFLIS